MKKVKVGKSKIHGNGLFANEPIKRGDVIELVHTIREIEPGVMKTTPTLLGRNYNHSDEPNALNVIDGNNRYLIALKEIENGGEITTNYRNNPDLEQPDSFTTNDNYISFDYDDTLTTPEGFKLAQQMNKDGNNLYVITARDKITPEMIERAEAAGIPKENIIAAGSDKEKVRIIKENNISKHIDNKDSVIKELGDKGELFSPDAYPDLKADYVEMDLSDEDLNKLKEGGFIIDKYPDGGIVELDGYRFKKDSSGNWVYESGAPVTDRGMIQRLNYEAKPVGSPVVQSAPKVSPQPRISSQERIQKINDLSKSPRLVDQEQAAALEEEQRYVDIYNPEVTPEEKIKPEGLQDFKNLEWDFNSALGYPFERAHTAAAAAASDPGEEVDNFRHPLAARYVAEGIADLTGNIPYLSPAIGFMGANLLGAGHEFMTLINPGEDERSFLTRLTEAGEDLYNNYVGAKVGASDMTPEAKTNYLLYLSSNNKLPDGVVIENPEPGSSKNLYFKKGPKDPGKYKSSYAVGGATSPKNLDPEHMKKYKEGLKINENSIKAGYKNGLWYPHHSVEGGADTIGYGHKLSGSNNSKYYKGLSTAQVEDLLDSDILKHQAIAKSTVDKKYGEGTFDSLPQDAQMLLVDYAYNGVLNQFPTFTKGVVEGDKNTMLKEYKRYSGSNPLTQRNTWTENVINTGDFSMPVNAQASEENSGGIQSAVKNYISSIDLNNYAKGGDVCPEGYMKDEYGACIRVQDIPDITVTNTYDVNGGKWKINNGVWTQLSNDAKVTNAHTRDRQSAYKKGKSERAFRNITPQGYGDLLKNLERYKRLKNNLGRDKNELRWDISPTGKQMYYSIPRRDDMFSLYLGLPQQNNSFVPQLMYRPTNEKDPSSLYYKPNYWTEKGKQALLDEYLQMSKNNYNKNIYNERDAVLKPIVDSLKKAGVPDWDPQYGTVFDNPLGDFTVTKGKDEYGNYISIYDKIDFNPFQTGAGASINPAGAALQAYMQLQGHNVNADTEASSLFGAGKPYEIYDRIYYDPKTKKVIKQNNFAKGGQYDEGGAACPEGYYWTGSECVLIPKNTQVVYSQEELDRLNKLRQQQLRLYNEYLTRQKYHNQLDTQAKALLNITSAKPSYWESFEKIPKTGLSPYMSFGTPQLKQGTKGQLSWINEKQIPFSQWAKMLEQSEVKPIGYKGFVGSGHFYPVYAKPSKYVLGVEEEPIPVREKEEPIPTLHPTRIDQELPPPVPPGPLPVEGLDVMSVYDTDELPMYATPDRDAQWIDKTERYIDWDGNKIPYRLPRFRKHGHYGDLIKPGKRRYIPIPSIESRYQAEIQIDPEEYQEGGVSKAPLKYLNSETQFYTVQGSDGVYRKVNGEWEVDWNRSGKFQPLSKGDVAKRSAVLNSQAKPLYDPVYDDMYTTKQSSYSALPKPSVNKKLTQEDKAAQKVFDESFDVKTGPREIKVEDYQYPAGTYAAASWESQKEQLPQAYDDVNNFYSNWYMGRATLPEFRNVALQRYTALNPQVTVQAQEPFIKDHPGSLFAITYRKNTSAKNKDRANQIFIGNVMYPDMGINDYYNKSMGDPKDALQYFTNEYAHEKSHWYENNFPQEGTNPDYYDNELPSKSQLYAKGKPTRDYFNIDTSPEASTWTNDRFKGVPAEQYPYLAKPTEVRARLNVWRTQNNIDPTKKYTVDEIRKIMDNNIKNFGADHNNIRELYKLINNNPEALKQLNDRYVSNDSNQEFNFAEKGGSMKYPNGGERKKKKRDSQGRYRGDKDYIHTPFPEEWKQTYPADEWGQSIQEIPGVYVTRNAEEERARKELEFLERGRAGYEDWLRKQNYMSGRAQPADWFWQLGALGAAGGLGDLLSAGETLGTKALPYIESALNTPLPRMASIPGATFGNALGSYFAGDAIVNRIPEIPGQISKGDYTGAATNILTSGLDLVGSGVVSPLYKGAKATGSELRKFIGAEDFSIFPKEPIPLEGYDLSKGKATKSLIPEVVQEQKVTEPWRMQSMPGLHLKSTMTTNPKGLHTQVAKDGTINVENALKFIKNNEGQDKYNLVVQALGQNVPKKMDYNQFRNLIQKKLVPLEKTVGARDNSAYGLQRLGYTIEQPNVTTYYSDGEAKIIENQTILLGNRNQFGMGSTAHRNPEETLGHIHFFRDSDTPDALTISQIQSDAFQGTHRSSLKTKEQIELSIREMEKDYEKVKKSYEQLTLSPDGFYQLPDGQLIRKDMAEARLKVQGETINLRKAELKHFDQKKLLDKNHQERYLQEIVQYAAERGDVNRIKLPTSETAAKVQNYSKENTWSDIEDFRNYMQAEYDLDQAQQFGDPEIIKSAQQKVDKLKQQQIERVPDYRSEHKTILKKYDELPKTIKKLYGVEPKIVTDSKGNTWYEFNIPYEFKEGLGEIKAFKSGGQYNIGDEVELTEAELESLIKMGYTFE